MKLKMLSSMLVVFLLLLPVGLKAQKQVTDFLEMGVEDARIVSEAYLQPYGEMLGKSLNGGWYNSAGVHRIGGFDLTFGVNMAMVPDVGKTFDVAALLPQMSEGWSLEDPNLYMAPTAAGSMPEALRPRLEYEGESVLTLPNGSGFDKLPAPMVQAAVGLPWDTEVVLRFIPSTSLGDAGKVNLYGFGVKHSLKQYIPFLKRMPMLQSSVMVGYTHLGSDVDVSAYGGGSDQLLEVTSGAFTSRLLVGLNMPILAVYTGVGYGTTNSDFALKGEYPGIGQDPFTLGYTTNGVDFNAGLRLRFGFFAIHGDYTFGDYSMLSAGVGINIR
ncbi:DUF6588 family protein [Geofilum rhodophaeum]|uniref:DUF6588 family protein n=1 Tax=Geofilum rhodophaeum TaxID=1965019 RepID=UPI000B5221B3|nr:DUF6588 family protein [Geofilum rhodophaeum]